MEGLEISEINKKQFNLDNIDFRIDAEYFSKLNLQLLDKLRDVGFKKIGDFSYVTDGIHTSIDYSNESDINLISATSPRENFFDLSRKVFISSKAHENNHRTALKENDVIISTVGTIGNCAVVTKSILPANSDRHVGIVRIKKDFLPKYVSTFLLTKYGRFQTWRESTGNVQLNLFLYKIKELKIADLSKPFQSNIEAIIEKANLHKEQSIKIYTQAENLLLETLGLQNFEPDKEPVNVKNLKESFLTSGRLDAEFYQKKYDIIENRIKKFGKFEKIKNIRTVNYRGLQPVYVEDGELDVINSKHILDTTLDYGNFEKTKQKNWILQGRARVFKGDILTYTTGANIGRTQVYLLDKKALASNHVNILRLKKSFNSSYIAFVMNSLIGRLQTEKFSAGSAQAELYPKDIDEFIIPLIDETDQLKIQNLIEESFRLKKQSEQLLELAKTSVEKAIEENEEAALAFINLEMKK